MQLSVIKTLYLLLALLCAFHSSPLCEAAVCYVKPTEPHNATCSSEPCYTLDEYIHMRNSTRCFVSNTVFEFISGHHNFSNCNNFRFSDIHNISLRPYIEKGYVLIDSEQIQTALRFEFVSGIVLRDINFRGTSIVIENCTNATLTGLNVITTDNSVLNTSIVLDNVLGAVSISNIKCTQICHTEYCHCIKFVNEWTDTYISKSTVLLNEVDLSDSGHALHSSGVSFFGCFPGKIAIENSIVKHLAWGITISVSSSCNAMFFKCKHTTFDSMSKTGLSISAPISKHSQERNMAVTLHNVSYYNNVGAVYFQNIDIVAISGCSFKNSLRNGAIVAFNSKLYLLGNITFINNYNMKEGGAFALIGNCRISITEPKNTYILFENNTSCDVGGAIYFSGSETYMPGNCKMCLEKDSSHTVFNFSMNTAVHGGNAIYGVYLDEPCYLPHKTLFQNLSQLIKNVSFFSPSFDNDLSVISSDAHKLCFCDENGKLGNCTGTQLSVYPGQIFGVPVAALGDMNGIVKWQVNAFIDTAIDPSARFGNVLQQSQNTNGQRCTNLQYSILSNKSNSMLYLSLSAFYKTYQKNVSIFDCPLGFALSKVYECDCHYVLLNNIKTITCNITETTIERQGTTWIGVLQENNATLAFSNVCPFLYCNKSGVKIHIHHSALFNEDIQCTDNRSGVLCGGCRENFSLALGSNRCLPGCSNNSLSLIIAFAAAGIALVFFIKILNLTVSQGTINGLIFYANIVGSEQSVLFSSKAYEGFLSVFIAWVNLDLGIETCFFDGMDSYTKAWLQFVFPAYVWAIALFIIILSHFSIRASRLFGNNSVPVLATLILLSYSKLLRAVISALSVTHIQFLNVSTMSVWERDGNIQYLTGKHIPLFAFAVAVLVLLWSPFTIILFSIQWLQRGTHYRVLHWITKLRPFFDAFTGPLKDKHRYWVGALLLVRNSLLFIFYIYTTNGNGVAFIAIIFAALIILFLLATTGSVYRKYYLTVLELSYIFNLGLLSAGTLYVRYINDKGNQEALIMTSVGIAFLQFMSTVIYYAYVKLRKPLKMKLHGLQNISEPEREEYNHEDYESLDGTHTHNGEQLQQPSFPNFREPLFEYLDD